MKRQDDDDSHHEKNGVKKKETNDVQFFTVGFRDQVNEP